MDQSTKAKRTKPEVYSRVVGYLRPVQQWNEGKREEFKDRKEFNPNNKPDFSKESSQEKIGDEFQKNTKEREAVTPAA